MRSWRDGFRVAAVCVSVLTTASLLSTTALANTAAASDSVPAHKITTTKEADTKVKAQPIPVSKSLPIKQAAASSSEKPKTQASKDSQIKGQKPQYVARPVRLQCVPFARAASGIQIKGNAANWWDSATGVYARGQAPEPGAVLNFRSTRGMRLGHVAVVTRVVSDREIEIDHANWAGPGASKGAVSRGMSVIDVSPDNSWTQVRVTLGGDKYGSIYPTYGFIYDRPDTGEFAVNHTRSAGYDEVAELPSHSLH